MKIKLKRGKVIAIRTKGKLIRYDENSEPFLVSSNIGKDLIQRKCAVLIEDEPDYESMKASELRELIKERGLEESGTKEELINRLREDSNDI